MSNDSTLPVISVTVTVEDNQGVYKVVYDPDPVPVAGEAVLLHYTLDSAGWVFGTISFAAPFSELQTISATEFTIEDAGGDQGTFAFSVQLVSAAAHRGQQEQIDTDPEVQNGPP
jgi:hypothetical protein